MLRSKSILRAVPISIAIAVLAQSSTAIAATASQDLKSCASAALAQRQQSADAITVDTGGFRKWALDHSASQKWNEYKMKLTGKVSGKEFGVVSCRVSATGKLISANFES